MNANQDEPSVNLNSNVNTHNHNHKDITNPENEPLHLVGNLNDIFVSIACLLVLIPTGSLMHNPFGTLIASWLLAEYFTRKRRMLLPSMLLMVTFLGSGLYALILALKIDMPFLTLESLSGVFNQSTNIQRIYSLCVLGCLPIGFGILANLYWRRFKVPATVAVGIGGILWICCYFLYIFTPNFGKFSFVITLLFGFFVFLLAMKWDRKDLARQTQSSDVAFWLHLVASPLIVHSAFSLMGIFDEGKTPAGMDMGTAFGILILYCVMGVVSLCIDRRAMLISALGYVLYALFWMFKHYGINENNAFQVTAIFVGLMLLLLSAFWQQSRKKVIYFLPLRWEKNLP